MGQNISSLLKRFLKQDKYDPVQYWNNRVNPNNAEGVSHAVQRKHIEHIRKFVRGHGPFLEYGPGIGRTLEAYEEGAKVCTIDISSRYAKEFTNNAAARGIRLGEQHVLAPLDCFPFERDSFSVAVASQVFLHVPPQQLAVVIKELLRVAEKTVVISAYRHNALARGRARHCFNHDYLRVVTDGGGVVDNCNVCDETIYFTMRGVNRE